jgi:hypothetical protein
MRLMLVRKKSIAGAFACLIALACASCLSMSIPKGAQVEPGGRTPGKDAAAAPGNAGGSNQTKASLRDPGIVDTWELLYQVNERGDQEQPTESVRTLLEFTDKGRVVFNKVDKDKSDTLKHQTGNYAVEKEEITITDDKGFSSRWPYQVSGDTLILVIPDQKKKFFWRRWR